MLYLSDNIAPSFKLGEDWNYLSANEIKGLPGVPLADRALRQFLSFIPSRPRAGRGGGVEYDVSALPASTQAAIAHREAIASIPFELLPAYGCQQPDIRSECARADAKAWYLSALKEFAAAHELYETRAREYFIKAIELGLITIPQAVKAIVAKVSATSLRRWQSIFASEGLQGLAGKWQGRVSKAQEIIQTIPHTVHHSARKIAEMVATVYPEAIQLTTRSINRLRAKFRREFPGEYLRAKEGDGAYKDKFAAREGSRSEGICRANQLWELDGTKTNVILADGKRYWIVAAIDVYSRRVVTYLTPANNKLAVLHGLMRKAILTLGIPEKIKIDNGSEYANNHLDTVCLDLNISIHRCNPGCPQEKPHIERWFGTMTRDLETGLPGFVGANTTDRQAWLDSVATLTPAEFATKLDNYAEYYNNRTHSALDRTPMEQWACSTANGTVIKKIKDERILDILLAEPVKGAMRMVQGKGIKVGRNWYASPCEKYEASRGKYLLVKHDAERMDCVYCYDQKGNYLFTAICPELAGITRKEFARQLKEFRSMSKKYKQICIDVSNITGNTVQPIERTVIADLPAIEQAKILKADVDRMQADLHQETFTDTPAPNPDAEPIDPLDRYGWLRQQIHQGKIADPDWEFLRRIESDRFNWNEVIEADLLYITPPELWEARPWDYQTHLRNRGAILRSNHPSIPWRLYHYLIQNPVLTAGDLQYCENFERDNPDLATVLRQTPPYLPDWFGLIAEFAQDLLAA